MITNSVKNIYPGMGSPAVSFTKNDFAVASGASTVACIFATPDPTAVQQGKGPVRQGKVRVKTEALVASFLVVAIVGKDALGNQVVLYHGDVATAITGVTSAYVSEAHDFISDIPLVEIDVMLNSGAAINASLEIAAGS